MTEIEIDYTREFYEDHTKILFCMITKIDYQNDEGKIKATIESEDNTKSLEKLKNKIREEYRDTNQIIEYDAVLEKEKGKFILSDNLKYEIINHILNNIEYGNYNIPQNIYDVNNNYFNTLINKNKESFDEKNEETNKILDFINNNKHKLLTLIGKTFLLSNVIKTLEASFCILNCNK